MALVHLRNVYGDDVIERTFPRPISFEGLPAKQVLAIAKRGVNSPLASSMGRLFDAVAFLLDCGALVSYEAEAAVALEALALEATDVRGAYEFEWKPGPAGYAVIDPSPVVAAIVDDLAGGRELTAIAAAFHRGVARLVVDLATELSNVHGCADVVLSGGVFQNRFLCECIMERAQGSPLHMHQHGVVPPNDGGIAFGQLVVGAARLLKGSENSDGR
jgi:hydrogenase maturation protein HypF